VSATMAIRHVSPFAGIRRFLRTPKGYLSIVFIPLLVVAAAGVGAAQVPAHLLFALLGAAGLELLIVRRERHAWVIPSSAILSGAIVAFVLSPDNAWLVTAAVGALATASKHILKTRLGHIFNPAALALAISIPIFATDQSWWGALAGLPWPFALFLVAGGLFIAERTYKFPVILAFGFTYFSALTLLAIVNPTGVAEMFRDPFVQSALFLAFFMLTDPPTSPGRPSEQIWYGVFVAAVSVIAQMLGAGQSYLLLGLLAGNAALAVEHQVLAPWRRRRSALT